MHCMIKMCGVFLLSLHLLERMGHFGLGRFQSRYLSVESQTKKTNKNRAHKWCFSIILRVKLCALCGNSGAGILSKRTCRTFFVFTFLKRQPAGQATCSWQC